jgi:glycine betaine/proline transport system substrate-binding protein
MRRRTLLLGTSAALLAAPAVLGRRVAAQGQAKRIKIGWTAWSDAEAVTKLVAKLLTERMGYEVELVMADIGLQYQGLVANDLDVMLMSWQPLTHAAYLEKVGKEVDDLGPIYTMARLGWVVPTYVPESELSSIEDLAKESVSKQLGGKVQGIDPGAGLMQASEKAIKEYGLSYELVSASDAGMLAAVERAQRRNEWIVATSWSPHWMFSKYQLRYLKDPKGALGGLETVNAVGRKGFYQDQPEAYAFLGRFHIALPDLEAIMFAAQASSVEQAVDDFVAKNPKLVDYWVTGKVA